MLSTDTASTVGSRRGNHEQLPTYRINLMRVAYLVMGVGLVVYRWPLLPRAAALPVMDGVVISMLTGLSLLAFLGLRYPIRMLPILLFESAWKLIWLAAVAVPHLISQDMDAATEKMFGSVLWVVIILALTPWDFAWKRYVKAPADRWRRGA
jgi:hypothetical protein